jgi:hypothetical protein
MPIRTSFPIAILIVGLTLALPAGAAAPPPPQRDFASAEEAATALVAALRDQKEADLRAILGPDADRLIDTGDPYNDREIQQRFVALFDQKHAIGQPSPGQAELDVGPDDWPLPIPIVQDNGRWRFDTKAGAQEIIDRRIGRNELSAIRTLLACIDAEQDFFARAKQTTGTGVYTARLASTPGKQDGLYWPVAEGETESPLGPLVDTAEGQGYPGELIGGKPDPYEGYFFRILTAEGSNANQGAKSYIRSGKMTGGFAFVAWPSRYETSGIMSFIAGPDGDVYQKDLGPDTASAAAAIKTFDPDLSWTRVEETKD